MSLANPSRALFVLLASPLVGCSSWVPVADELDGRGREAIVPVDLPEPPRGEPVWRVTLDAVSACLRGLPRDRQVALVGHSRAGPLLPVVGTSLRQPIAAYILVDSRLPHGGLSPLEALEAENPGAAAERQAHLEAGGRYPAWSDDDLRHLVPDPERRRKLLAELRPRGPEFWAEPLPTVPDWPDAPCGYLVFSPAYRQAAESARRAGWLVRELPAGHFHQLVDPAAVADALIGLVTGLSEPTRA